jgi:hypothetical protein
MQRKCCDQKKVNSLGIRESLAIVFYLPYHLHKIELEIWRRFLPTLYVAEYVNQRVAHTPEEANHGTCK